MKRLVRILSTLVVSLDIARAISVQENYTICNWARLRAGVIRDALYLDGGLLWWQTAFADGTTPVVSSDGNAAGDMFRLNFSLSYDTSTTNLSALFEQMPKAGGAGNNIAPNYIDGAMLTNDDELYLYGGLPRLTDSVSAQSADAVLGYEAYQYGPHRDSWSPGFYQGGLSSGVNRYITNGAGVSVPSENLAFYFSGMRSPDWGPIYYEDSSANVSANTLIEVDMSTMRSENWSNITLPDNIAPRANAELVWIPVSEQGVLVAIGGVNSPEEIWATGLNMTQTSESKAESPSYMTTLPVYDIASKTWYLQNTTGTSPGQLTEFCSVVATANDSSSFNVYIYGGYDGLNSNDQPSDDVWVLSIPSFTWIKVYQGHSSHGRSGHKCVAPYPDKMLVVGGVHQNQANCVEGGIIQVFNLNTLQFQDIYNPDEWADYQVPNVVTKAIGGTSGGGSKSIATWSNSTLANIFRTKYSKQIIHYYPYKSTNLTITPPSSSHSSNSNHTIAIAVGVAAALVFLILLIVLLLIIRRRQILRSSASESSSAKRSRIGRWINGTPAASLRPKSDDPSSETPEVQQINSYSSISDESPAVLPERHEMAATERPLPPFELATPYNNQEHPRHSGIVDYAYDPMHGHSHSHSRSTDSNYDVNQSSPADSTTNLHNTSVSPVAWPLPTSGFAPAQNTWHTSNITPPSSFSNHSSQSQHTPAVPPIPEQYRSLQPHQLQPQRLDSSESSGIDTLPSPIGEGSMSPAQSEDYRRSLHGGGGGPISPVSPLVRQGPGTYETWWQRM